MSLGNNADPFGGVRLAVLRAMETEHQEDF